MSLLQGSKFNMEGFKNNTNTNTNITTITNLYDSYKIALNEYETEKSKYLADLNKSFIFNNKNNGKNVKFSDNSGSNIGYVTNKGTYKWYPNNKIYTNTSGKFGCPSSYVTINQQSNNLNKPGLMSNTTPNFFIGSNMKDGQSCVNVGENYYTTGTQDIKNNNVNYLGCYKGDITNNYKKQTDIKIVTYDKCLNRAADLGMDSFFLQNNTKLDCYVGKINNQLITNKNKSYTIGGYLYNLSYSKDKLNNSAGILNDGTIAIATIPSGTKNINFGENATNIKNPIGVPIPGCNQKSGISIQVVGATYGANCNGMIMK
jgi:hypothetical protein